MISDKPHIITVTNPDGEFITLSLPWDADITVFLDAFKVILKWATFADETIKECFGEE